MSVKHWGLVLELLVALVAVGAAGVFAAKKLSKRRQRRSQEPATVVGDVNDPLLVIQPIPDFSREAVPIHETPKALVQHLLEVFVECAGVEGGAPRDVRIELSPGLQVHLATGSYESIVQRANQGGIHLVERDPLANKVLRELERLQPINSGLMATSVWQLAATLTAQKYLFEIRGQLEALRRELSSVGTWFENHNAAKIESDFKHVQSIAEVFMERAVEERDLEVYAHTLEDVGRETRQLMSLQLRRLERLVLEVKGHDWSPGWTAAAMVGRSNAAIAFEDRYRRFSMAYLFAARTRLIAAAVRGQFGLDRRHATRLIHELDTELQTFVVQYRDVIPAELLRTADILRARISRKGTKEAIGRNLRSKLTQATEQVAAEADDVVRAARLIESRLAEPAARLALEARVDPAAKKVVEVRQLP